MYILYYSTDVAWFRGPTLLEDNADNVEIWRQRDRHFLRLYDIQNSSFYSCTALNTLGEVTHHFRLGLKKGKKTKIVCHICLQYVICRKKCASKIDSCDFLVGWFFMKIIFQLRGWFTFSLGAVHK